MKHFVYLIVCIVLIQLTASALNAQGTAFTYQGQLNNNGVAANGNYDLAFTLYATNVTGTAIASSITNRAVAATNGLFTTLVDFGNAFTGTSNWLEIAVSTNGANSFFTLAPRQRVTPTPYALTAASLSGVLPASTLPNFQSPNYATIGGGSGNLANIVGGTVGGGFLNSATLNYYTTVGGGVRNLAEGYSSTIAGGFANTNSGSFSTIAGGDNNNVSGIGDFIGGGGFDGSSVAGNIVQANAATIGGGLGNDISSAAVYAVIGGGAYNLNTSLYATLGGGYNNFCSGPNTTVSGGQYNIAGGNAFATVSGGQYNTAGGYCATVDGGQSNIADGTDSFAAGNSAQAMHQGTFVWADSQGSAFASTANNQFLIRAAGGVGINTASPQSDLSINGGLTIDQGGLDTGTITTNSLRFGSGAGEGIGSVRVSGMGDSFGLNFYTDYAKRLTILQNGNVGIGITNPVDAFEVASGGVAKLTLDSSGNLECAGTVYSKGTALTSDRNLKENFQPVDYQAILTKVVSLPVTEWNYKSDNKDVQHIGPMAQDFHAAFGLNGVDDKHIATVDEEGVALAAIQGLNQELQTRMKDKDAEILNLQTQLNALQAVVKRLAKAGGTTL